MIAPNYSKSTKIRYSYILTLFNSKTSEKIIDECTSYRLGRLSKKDNPKVSGNVFPEAILTLRVNSDDYVKIHDQKSNLVIQLSITAITQKIDQTGAIEIVGEKPLWDCKFQAIITSSKQTTLPSSENASVTTNPDGTISAATPDVVDKIFEIPMIISCMEHRSRFKVPLNFNAGAADTSIKSTVADVLAYALNTVKCGIGTVIFQKPDRQTPFKQIPVVPVNLKGLCNHLQTVFGVYKTGLTLFQDYKYLYILPTYSKDYAVPKGEYNKISIYQLPPAFVTSAPNLIGMYVNQDESEYAMVQSNSFRLIDLEEFVKETGGNKMRILMPQASEDALNFEGNEFSFQDPMTDYSVDIQGNTLADDKTKYYYNELGNEYLNEELMTNLKSASKIGTLTLRDVDISLLTFNRSYFIYFAENDAANQDNSGEYMLLMVKTDLVAQENQTLNSIAQLTLLKV